MTKLVDTQLLMTPISRSLRRINLKKHPQHDAEITLTFEALRWLQRECSYRA